MTGPGRISLRARLLIVLIAVTAAFLLIMGGVTTLVLSRQLSQQFNADLIAYAAHPPRETQSAGRAATSPPRSRSGPGGRSCSPRARRARSYRS